MKFILISLLVISSGSVWSVSSEMQKMKELHAQCMNSKKSSANCHEDLMKACDASREECMKIMERMNMQDVQKAQERPKKKSY